MSSENKGTGTYQPIILCNVTAKSVKTKILGVFELLWAGFEAKAGTRMTRIKQIITDIIRVNPSDPCHPCSKIY